MNHSVEYKAFDALVSKVLSVSHRGDKAARRGIPQACRCEPKKARTETEGQAFRFLGPRGDVHVLGPILSRTFQFAGEFFVGEALAYNLTDEIAEPIRVRHRQAVVISKGLFVQIPEQV